MQTTLSWIKEYLETNATVDEIADKLSSLGLVVDDVKNPAEGLESFVIAQVEAAVQHPDADRLKLCTVNNGSEKLQVVCGGTNVRVGMKTVFASIGTYIPGTGITLKPTQIRGQDSQGMMCSGQELLLEEDSGGGIMDLNEDAPVGENFAKYAGLDDPVFDIEITPNRGDCLGAYGIARDLAATGIGKLKAMPAFEVKGTFENPIKISIGQDARDDCSIYYGRYIKGVKNGESPAWMQTRLRAIGLRPISALVDVTNYICHAIGRPMHVFDADKLSGNVTVRMAKNGEKFQALDDKEYTLSSDMVVVADDKAPHALGGVIGGMESGCELDTTNVLLEAAIFDPISITMAGRNAGIITDSRYRFERGVDAEILSYSIEWATQFILEHCGGQASEVTVVGSNPEKIQSVKFDPEMVKRLTGLSLSNDKIKQILEGLGFEVPADWNVKVPSWRHDIKIPQDLVEEVTRVNGYDSVEPVMLPKVDIPNGYHPDLVFEQLQQRMWSSRRALASRGLNEAMTWSFLNTKFAKLFEGGNDSLRLVNPISSELSDMRPSLLPNLIAASQRNADRGLYDACLFEAGTQYKDNTPEGEIHVASGIRAGNYGQKHWAEPARKVDVYDAKADAQAVLLACGIDVGSLQVMTDGMPSWYHPGRSGRLCLGPKTVLAYFGEIHPAILQQMDVKQTIVGFEVFLENIPAARSKRPKALKISNFQPVERDFAFVVSNAIASSVLVSAIAKVNPGMITDVKIFDVYAGKGVEEGCKSIAVTVRLEPTQGTLTEEDISGISSSIIESVQRSTQGYLRV